MTKVEALQEARRLWGKLARAWRPFSFQSKDYVFAVGLSNGPRIYKSVTGSGSSWEAAFADADRRAALPETKEKK